MPADPLCDICDSRVASSFLGWAHPVAVAVTLAVAVAVAGHGRALKIVE